MRFLVTGGSGFIGSNLIDYLLKEGHEVINFDIRKPRIDLPCKYIKGNILNLEEMLEATVNIDTIFHLAAEAKVDDYFKEPIVSSDTNVLGTIKVLESARRNSVRRVLFASSEWIYSGVKDTDHVDEETKVYPPAPPHLYSSSKIAGELACLSYQDIYRVHYTIMRFGIPFGPMAWPGTVTPIFLRKIFRGEPITIRGKGDQFRQFVYIKDLVRGIYSCVKTEAEDQIINLNGRGPVTILDIVRVIEKGTALKASIQTISDRPGDFKGYFVSSSKAKRLLGWEPIYDYEEAMKEYIGWFKEKELNQGNNNA